MIGHAGISMQVYGDEELPEIGYMFEKEFWHRGFATEAAIACRDYAFAVLGMDTVYSVIRADNVPSRAVARRNGMRITGTAFRSVMGRMVTHYMYSIKKPHIMNHPNSVYLFISTIPLPRKAFNLILYLQIILGIDSLDQRNITV